MNEDEQLLKMINVQKEKGLLTESEYNRMYHRITGEYNLTADQMKFYHQQWGLALGSINNLLGLGLITQAKADLLSGKAKSKLMKLASEQKEEIKEDE